MAIPDSNVEVYAQVPHFKEKTMGETTEVEEKLNRALQLGVNKNNSGTVRLRNKNFQLAIGDFVEALKAVQMLMKMVEDLKTPLVLSEPEHTETVTTGIQEKHLADFITVRYERKFCHNDNRNHMIPDSSLYSKNENISVLSEPLLLEVRCPSSFLQELREAARDTISQQLRTASMVIIFNLGLSYHLMAENHPLPTSRGQAKKALSFYRLFQKSLEEGDFEIEVVHWDHRRCLSLSSARLLFQFVLNNVSHLHSTWGEYNTSLDYKHALLKCVLWLAQEFKTRNMDPTVLEDFFQSTMGLIIRDSISAPAA